MKKHIIIILIIGIIFIFGFYACPIYRTVGIPCPGCGVTRAYILFLQGHYKDAFLMHPLFLMPLLFLIKPLRKNKYIIIASLIFIAVYVIRMIYLFPDTPPMNYNYDSTLGVFLK